MIEVEEKSSPLINYYESLGGNTIVSEGKKVVKNFTSLESELGSLYDGIGIRDISHYGVIELKGSDSLDFLHRITSNSLKNLNKEGIANTIFTSEKGRIIDYSKVINFEDYQVLICSPENQSKVLIWINKYIITDDVKPADVNGKYNILELIGPQADSFVSMVCGNIVSAIKPNTFKIINTEGIIFFLLRIKDENEKMKFWILSSPANGEQLLKYMIEHKGIFDFNLVGEEAYNIYRIENGIPAAPNEINLEYNPHEAGLLSAVDFKKGCYIGQEVIARLDTYDKVKRNLKGVAFSEPVEAEKDIILFDENNNEAGKVTSSAYSIKFKKYIGLAYIKKAYSNPGTNLNFKNSLGNPIQAAVENLPFSR